MSQGDRVAAERFLNERDHAEGRRRGDAELLYGTYFYIYSWIFFFFLAHSIILFKLARC